jgi:NAD-dependent deacetylase
MKMRDRCEYGSQLKLNIVWFGKAVPNIEPAIKLVEKVDLMLVIGTNKKQFQNKTLEKLALIKG